MRFVSIAAAIALNVASTAALAHGDTDAMRTSEKAAAQLSEQKEFGKPGDPKKIRRTIRIKMDDSMHFAPEKLDVMQGDTVRIVVTNAGKLMHELVIGTMRELKEHAELMRRFPGMKHEEPYMVHVPAGKTGNIVWHFNKPGEFNFACLVAGHMEAGMLGKIVVANAAPEKARAPVRK